MLVTRSSGGDWRRGTGLAALLVPLLGVLACHSAPTRGADSGVGLTKAAVPSTIDWDRVASGLELVRDEIRSYYWKYLVTPDLLDLRNLHLVATLIVRSAISRKESRGLHYNADYPEPDDQAFRRDTTLVPDGEHL